MGPGAKNSEAIFASKRREAFSCEESAPCYSRTVLEKGARKASRPGDMAWPGQVGECRVFHHESGPSQSGRRHGRGGMRGQHGGPGAVGSNGLPPSPFPHPRGFMLPPAPPASVVGARMRAVQAQVDQLIAVLEPCFKSEERRMAIFHHIRAIVEERFPCLSCHMMGSFPLKTYLPDSDLDMTICTRQRVRRQQLGDAKGLEEGQENDDLLVCVNEAICRAAISRRRSSAGRREDIMEIRSISLVNARTPVVNCLVQNVSVDITINQTGSLATLTFLEEVDRSIGNEHLFKRSLLLLKAWCLHESQKYVGVPILGSKANGGLTSYALSVMVLCLFTAFATPEPGGERPVKMMTPFDVMLRFLQVYSTFDWSKQVLSLEGPVPTTSVNVHRSRSPSASSPRCRFSTVMERVREYSVDTPTSRDGNSSRTPDEAACPSFPVKICNIEDPLNPTNNLGYSLNRQSLQFLQHSIAEGRRHLDYLLSLASHFDVLPYSPPPNAGMAPMAPSPCTSDAPQAPLARKPRSDSKDAAVADLPSPPPLQPPLPSCSPSLPPCLDPPPFIPAPFAGAPYPQAPGLYPPVGPLPPGPLNPWMGISLVAAYFPRLVQLYQDPAARRSDLLNHPCESRTGMFVCDDASTVTCDNGRPKSFLAGDVNHFWYTLTTTVAERRRRRRTRSQGEEEGEEADGNELLQPPSLTPVSLSPSTTVVPNCTNSPNSPASSTDCTRNCNAPLPLLEPGPRHVRSLLLEAPHHSLSKPSAAVYSGACSTSSRDTVALTSTTTSSPCSPCSLSSLSSQSPPPRPLLEDDCHTVRRLSNDDIIKSAQRRLWARHHEQQQQHKADEDKGPAIMALQASNKACASPSPLASPPVEQEDEEEEQDQPMPPPLSTDQGPTTVEKETPSPDVNSGSASAETGEAEPAGNPGSAKGCKDGEAATTPTVEGEEDRPASPQAPQQDAGVLCVKSPVASPEQEGHVATAPPTPTTEDKAEDAETLLPHRHHKSRHPTCYQPQRKGGYKGADRRGRKGSKEGRHHHHQHAPDCPLKAKKEAVREVGVQVAEEGVRLGTSKSQGPWTAVAWLSLCCAVAMCCLAGTMKGGRASSVSADKVALGQDEGGGKRKELVHWIREDSRLCLGSRFGDTGDEDEEEQDGTTPAELLSSVEVGPSGQGEETAWFQWLKDGVLIAESAGRAEAYAIEHAGVADEGHYTLVLRNATHEGGQGGGGQTLGSTWVRIARPPRIHFKPASRMVLRLGSPLTLSIMAEGSPPPQHQWKLNGVSIDGAQSATHIIPSVGASHMGTYTCEVWNMAGRVVWEEAVVAIGF